MLAIPRVLIEYANKPALIMSAPRRTCASWIRPVAERRSARGVIERQLNLHPPPGLIRRSQRDLGQRSLCAVRDRKLVDLPVVGTPRFEVRRDHVRVGLAA